jgi:hypothetical protein
MKRIPSFLLVGWGLFVVSFFIPVHSDGSTLADGTVPGIEAMMEALKGHAGPVGIASGLTNIIMLATLALYFARVSGFKTIMLVLTAAAALLNAYWFFYSEPRAELLAGYYAWWISFAVVAYGLALQRDRSPIPAGDNVVACF